MTRLFCSAGSSSSTYRRWSLSEFSEHTSSFSSCTRGRRRTLPSKNSNADTTPTCAEPSFSTLCGLLRRAKSLEPAPKKPIEEDKKQSGIQLKNKSKSRLSRNPKRVTKTTEPQPSTSTQSRDNRHEVKSQSERQINKTSEIAITSANPNSNEDIKSVNYSKSSGPNFQEIHCLEPLDPPEHIPSRTEPQTLQSSHSRKTKEDRNRRVISFNESQPTPPSDLPPPLPYRTRLDSSEARAEGKAEQIPKNRVNLKSTNTQLGNRPETKRINIIENFDYSLFESPQYEYELAPHSLPLSRNSNNLHSRRVIEPQPSSSREINNSSQPAPSGYKQETAPRSLPLTSDTYQLSNGQHRLIKPRQHSPGAINNRPEAQTSRNECESAPRLLPTLHETDRCSARHNQEVEIQHHSPRQNYRGPQAENSVPENKTTSRRLPSLRNISQSNSNKYRVIEYQPHAPTLISRSSQTEPELTEHESALRLLSIFHDLYTSLDRQHRIIGLGQPSPRQRNSSSQTGYEHETSSHPLPLLRNRNQAQGRQNLDIEPQQPSPRPINTNHQARRSFPERESTPHLPPSLRSKSTATWSD